jgi:hypothetical protein
MSSATMQGGSVRKSLFAAFAAMIVGGAPWGTSSARAQVTYNLSGYGSGAGGSTNGADGQPAAVPPAVWTNGGVAAYTGALPVMWYAGVQSLSDVRTIETGAGATPPNGSLLQQVGAYNALNDPDLPTDRVLAVGGLSWSDPGNGNQGWGHGLDYGLIQCTPLAPLLANGPVKLTVTVQDDPSDGASPRLAFALYGGWDGNAASSRHQTFVTSPAPVNDPLGATGLTLLDFAVAPGAGLALSRTVALDATYDGRYTLFVGALDGVIGQYQVTVSLAPDAELDQCLDQLASTGTCPAELAQCQSALATASADADGDGVGDAADICPATPAATAVDADGCSQAQFCAAVDATVPKTGKKVCERADWRNDEPLMKLGVRKGDQDCVYDKGTKVKGDERCVAFVPSAP